MADWREDSSGAPRYHAIGRAHDCRQCHDTCLVCERCGLAPDVCEALRDCEGCFEPGVSPWVACPSCSAGVSRAYEAGPEALRALGERRTSDVQRDNAVADRYGMARWGQP